MKTVRFTATILSYLSRLGAILSLATAFYATAVLLLFRYSHGSALPIKVENTYFTIFYPFTKKAFLLGDYTPSYLFTSLFTLFFYGFFLWLLGDVLNSFRRPKLFTRQAVIRLSRFYITNLVVPFLLLLLVIIFQNEISDLIRVMLLHLVIGVFAYFMAAIFRQGLILQEEQDLTF